MESVKFMASIFLSGMNDSIVSDISMGHLVSGEMHRIADFVRGFFRFLKDRSVQAAVLHGGADGFEHELSDVDFVVGCDAFSRLARLIDEHCTRCGWQLCQVLRHETSAAYFVCSAADDAACAVALDACSDYQRHGRLFLTAESLLQDLQPLPWGGQGLSAANELRYRFAKAAAKNKDVSTVAAELSRFPEQARRVCEAWLQDGWGIALAGWDGAGIAAGLSQLRGKSPPRMAWWHPGALRRMVTRIVEPTGMVMVTGAGDCTAVVDHLARVFGHLYFRRVHKTDRWHLGLVKDLIGSTLIVVPELPMPWEQLVPRNCRHHLDFERDPETQCRELAAVLHARCQQREIR